MAMALSRVVILSSFLVFCMALPCLATVYKVGDSNGWTLGENYTSWTDGKSFVVGDSLEFDYSSGQHTVNEVTESNYQSCTSSNSISTDSSGKTTIALTKTGSRYFICAVANHCSSGMKLAVTVESGSGSGSPISPTPTTESPPSNSTSAPPPPPPPPSSSSPRSSLSSLLAMVLVGWYALRVVFLPF